MKTQSAEVLNVDGKNVLRIETDEGTAYVIEPKEEALAVAVVVSGPDVASGKFPTITTTMLPAAGRVTRPQVITSACQDPVVLELARRFATAPAEVGPVMVPTFEEADAAVWAFEAGRLVRK